MKIGILNESSEIVLSHIIVDIGKSQGGEYAIRTAWSNGNMSAGTGPVVPSRSTPAQNTRRQSWCKQAVFHIDLPHSSMLAPNGPLCTSLTRHISLMQSRGVIRSVFNNVIQTTGSLLSTVIFRILLRRA